MNNRRIFLTKGEVRNFGVELTESTTDDIAVLYLPLDTDLLTGNGSIVFDYRTKDHTDVNTRFTSGNYTSYIENTNSRINGIPISLNSDNIRLKYNLTGPTTNVVREYMIYFNGLLETTNLNTPNSGNSDSYFRVHISKYMDVTDLYIKIDITKINMRVIGGTFTDFLIKYKSGNIPADTIFYEPYED